MFDLQYVTVEILAVLQNGLNIFWADLILGNIWFGFASKKLLSQLCWLLQEFGNIFFQITKITYHFFIFWNYWQNPRLSHSGGLEWYLTIWLGVLLLCIYILLPPHQSDLSTMGTKEDVVKWCNFEPIRRQEKSNKGSCFTEHETQGHIFFSMIFIQTAHQLSLNL